MRSDVARSIALVMLMIVSVQMPMFDNAEEPVELKEDPILEMAPANPCQGYDACLGLDAGRIQYEERDLRRFLNSWVLSVANLTTYVDYGSTSTSTTFYGYMDGFSSSGLLDDDDVYTLVVPWGYGINVTVSWNSTYTMMYGAIGSSGMTVHQHLPIRWRYRLRVLWLWIKRIIHIVHNRKLRQRFCGGHLPGLLQ